MKQLNNLSYSDTIILASGDDDFTPAIMEAIKITHNIEIWSFQSGKYKYFSTLLSYRNIFSSS